jgi:hypothetical protein
VFEVEVLKSRLTDLAHPCASQHAKTDDVGRTAILGRLQCLGQLADFLVAQEAFARVLDPAAETGGRIVVTRCLSKELSADFMRRL